MLAFGFSWNTGKDFVDKAMRVWGVGEASRVQRGEECVGRFGRGSYGADEKCVMQLTRRVERIPAARIKLTMLLSATWKN
jgi:hypothetical protein